MSKRPKGLIHHHLSDEGFLRNIRQFEGWVSKLLTIAMVIVIVVVIFDLGVVLATELLNSSPSDFLISTLPDIFGLFLSVLIALEIMENITAYLRKHVVQVDLVIVTSLTAVASKIILLDLDKVSGTKIIGLGTAILALSISYFIVRSIHSKGA